MHFASTFILLAIGLASCRKETVLCGSPVLSPIASYEIVDAATGQNWFAGAGRPSGDSLRLLASERGPSQQAVRFGSGTRLGPVLLVRMASTPIVNGRAVITQLLRFSRADVDTVVTYLSYGPTQRDPCGEYSPLEEVEVTYNGRPNGTFRASVPADSVSQFQQYPWGKVLKLRKR